VGAADAVLATHAVQIYPIAECKPVAVRGLRVYPPDETAAVFIAGNTTACSVNGVGRGRVRPLAAGPGS
jgi:hypothetical protein